MLYDIKGRFVTGENWHDVCRNQKELQKNLKSIFANKSILIPFDIYNTKGENITNKIIKF